MHVVHTSAYVDAANRPLDALLQAWPTLPDVAIAAASQDAKVSVVIPAAADETITMSGVTFIGVATRQPGSLRRRLGFWATPPNDRLERAVAQLRPDVVHMHSLSLPLHIRRLARRLAARPILVQDHADHPPRRWLNGVYRRGLRSASAVAFTSAEQASPFLERGLLRPDVRVFEVPESSSRFSPGDMAAAREQTGLHGDPCLLWLGHLDPNKDPLCVLDAVGTASSVLPDLHLWMAWRNGALLSQVRERVEGDAALRHRVHLLGAQPHTRVEMLLCAADFLIQASHVEGSGYAVIEALACGVTPIVTAIPSFRALTEGGSYGGLTPPGDADALAASLIRWSARDRSTLRQRARAHFERALSFEAIGARLRDCYGVLHASATPRPAASIRKVRPAAGRPGREAPS